MIITAATPSTSSRKPLDQRGAFVREGEIALADNKLAPGGYLLFGGACMKQDSKRVSVVGTGASRRLRFVRNSAAEF